MPRSPRVVMCGCEDVTLDDIDRCLERGYDDLESVKRFTGFGTGICQGRSCLALVCRYLVERGVESESVAPLTPRPPLEPLALAALAGAAGEKE